MRPRWERERADGIRGAISPRAPQAWRHAAVGRAAVLDAVAERHAQKAGSLRAARHVELPDRMTLGHRIDEFVWPAEADKSTKESWEHDIGTLVRAVLVAAASTAVALVILDASIYGAAIYGAWWLLSPMVGPVRWRWLAALAAALSAVAMLIGAQHPWFASLTSWRTVHAHGITGVVGHAVRDRLPIALALGLALAAIYARRWGWSPVTTERQPQAQTNALVSGAEGTLRNLWGDRAAGAEAAPDPLPSEASASGEQLTTADNDQDSDANYEPLERDDHLAEDRPRWLE